MAQQFKEQGGAATMDPSALRRWLTSKLMTTMSGKGHQEKQRDKAEQKRQKNNEPHRVEYFHQVDDAYSHLAAQVLAQLSQRYAIDLRCYLVGGPTGDNAPEPDMLLKLSRYDSFHTAPHYGLEFPEHESPVDSGFYHRALSVLASLLENGGSDTFVSKVVDVGRALWNEDETSMSALEQDLGTVSAEKVNAVLEQGVRRRADLKHYSGAMFYYGGEWYWGVDRLYHLEQRLIDLGLDETPDEPLIVPRPTIDIGPLKDDGSMTLEVYPSLRSPYTAICFDQTVKLAKATGVTLKLLPVLPMVMRGVPATREKGQYILFDTGREARAAGVSFGPCYDPIGEPARRAYSLLSLARKQNKEIEFISSFIRNAWTEAVNTNNDKGMKKVVEEAGLNWSQAIVEIGNSDWEKDLEANRLAMYDLGLWGVPSFRLLDQKSETLLALWGQDRLWIVAKEIQRALRAA